MSSALDEYKALQKRAFTMDITSDVYFEVSDRMDVLYICLSADGILEAQEELRQLWIDKVDKDS